MNPLSNPRPPTPHSPSDVLDHFVRHVEAGDLDAALALYEPDATMVEKPGRVVRGTADIRQALSALIQSGVRLAIDTTHVLHASDLAFVVSTWSVRATTVDGLVEVARGEGTDVMRQQRDGTWRFVFDNPFGPGLQP